MNRTRILLYHLLAWGLIIGYNSWWIIFRNGGSTLSWHHLLLLQLTFWLSLMALFYFCLLAVFPYGIRRGQLPLLGLGLLAAPVVFMGTRYGLEEVLLPHLFGFRNYAPGVTLRFYVLDNLYFLVPTVALAAVVWGAQEALRYRETERRLQLDLYQLEQERAQAELAFLKTQINPHFLYNTLNYIYSEAYPLSEPLAAAVLRLSDLMRYMLHESPDGKMELRKEVEYVQNYLALHTLRFEQKFFVEFQQHGSIHDERVAALLLIPFVENALKHGITSQPERPVQISLRLPAPGRLHFEVRNYISHHHKDPTTGIGLANVRRRLELLYPGQHQLTVHNDGVMHHTRLELTLG